MLCGDGNIDFTEGLIAFLVICGLLFVAWHSLMSYAEAFEDQPKPVIVSRAEALNGIRTNFEAEMAILRLLLPYYTVIVDTAAKTISAEGMDLAAATAKVETGIQKEAPGKVISVRQTLDSIQDVLGRAGVPDEVKYMTAYAYLPQNIATYGTTYNYLIGKAQQIYKNLNNMSAPAGAAPLPKVQGATAAKLGVSIQAFTDASGCCGAYNPILEKVNDAYKSNSDKLLQEYYNISMTRRRALAAATDDLKVKETEAEDIFGRLAALQRQITGADSGKVVARVLDGSSLTTAVEGLMDFVRIGGGGAGLAFSN